MTSQTAFPAADDVPSVHVPPPGGPEVATSAETEATVRAGAAGAAR
ncbi:hypothetical protein [Streptomyces sp. NPDC005752]